MSDETTVEKPRLRAELEALRKVVERQAAQIDSLKDRVRKAEKKLAHIDDTVATLVRSALRAETAQLSLSLPTMTTTASGSTWVRSS